MRPVVKIGLVLALAVMVVAGLTPAPVNAATSKLEVSGWIPYWRAATGTAEALAHLDTFTEINPFGYTVKQDGTLFDALRVDEAPWPALIAAAKDKKIRVIPTVMWANAEAMDKTFRSAKLRKAHVAAIVAMVKSHNFDGVDIDYEGKSAKTKDYFSLFLRDLYKALGNKWVMCTIESRTPLDSRYDTIPTDIKYANDFVAINKYCDRVRIMAYDQGSIDLKLNKANVGPYAPVADPVWVEKVMRLVAKTISKKKLELGIPTYGYEYEVTPMPDDGYRYKLKWAFNPKYGWDLAKQLGIRPERNSAGELSFSYATTTAVTPVAVTTDISLSNNDLATTSSVAGTAVPATTKQVTRLVWWSDASAIQDKILLAKKLGLRGVSIFKIDGGADPVMWNVLKDR